MWVDAEGLIAEKLCSGPEKGGLLRYYELRSAERYRVGMGQQEGGVSYLTIGETEVREGGTTKREWTGVMAANWYST